MRVPLPPPARDGALATQAPESARTRASRSRYASSQVGFPEKCGSGWVTSTARPPASRRRTEESLLVVPSPRA